MNKVLLDLFCVPNRSHCIRTVLRHSALVLFEIQPLEFTSGALLLTLAQLGAVHSDLLLGSFRHTTPDATPLIVNFICRIAWLLIDCGGPCQYGDHHDSQSWSGMPCDM